MPVQRAEGDADLPELGMEERQVRLFRNGRNQALRIPRDRELLLSASQRWGEGSVLTSVIVACELRYGAAKRGSRRLTKQVEAVLGALTIRFAEI